MRRIQRQGDAAEDHLYFRVSAQERLFLIHLLRLYPVVPPDHHRLSRESELPDEVENQQLLEESLAGQVAVNRKLIASLLAEPGRFKVVKSGLEFPLTRVEAEELLQILNDVRVGSWLALGSPDHGEEDEYRNKSSTKGRHVLAMDLAGALQMELLNALGANEE